MQHLEHLPATPCVVVANHASYLDGVVLFAALPPSFGFVIKREMSNVPLANLLLRRIGSHFVDRGSGHKGARDTRKLLKRAHAGGALAFFPEGTFQLRARPRARFAAAPSSIAAKAQLPIVPVAIRGTRARCPPAVSCRGPDASAWNSRHHWRHRLRPQRTDLGVARRAARQAILARIDEPDLAPQD